MPYGTEFDTPASRGRVEAFLRKLGADDRLIKIAKERINDVDVQQIVNRFKTYGEANSNILLGALAAIALGVATEEVVRRTASKRKPAKRRASSKSKSKSSKRTLIEPHRGDKRYIRRDSRGRIKESVEVGRSLAADRRHHSKRRAKKGEGDRGDR
ncbi:MAG TPA: hypothetical protein VJ853_12505 [Thermoanaerobaculia bacterium]|nr:hypothetical protein [Thermoanaerobaculia bacterium]